MNNELQIFTNEQLGDIRTIMQDGEPWFVAADICKMFGVSNSRSVTSRLYDDEKGVSVVDTPGGKQNLTVVNEGGLYHLLFSMEPNNARGLSEDEVNKRINTLKEFRCWVTHKVLPSIRKHGAYMTEQTLEDALTSPDFLIRLATQLKEEQEARRALEAENAVQAQQIAEFQPKASYYDVVLNCKDLMSVSKIAKDYGKSAVWLNAKLHELGVQYKQGDIWLLYQKYAEMGYTSTKTHVVNGTDGMQHSKVNTCWTPKGRLFVYELLKANGILPLIESNNATA